MTEPRTIKESVEQAIERHKSGLSISPALERAAADRAVERKAREDKIADMRRRIKSMPESGTDDTYTVEQIHDLAAAQIADRGEAVLVLDPKTRPFGRLPAHVIEEVDPAVRGVIRAVCQRGGPWPLVFTGGVGTGKTCAALCVLDYVRGKRRYETVGTLCERLISTHRENAMETRRGILGDWKGAELTVLDELSMRANVSDHHYDAVKSAIDLRDGRPAIFISNDSISGIGTMYDDRIASRLAAGTVIEFEGEDRRVRR